MSGTLQANEEACLSLLRDADRDRYLACLLSPVPLRGKIATLYAFNAELARVRDQIRDPLPGEVRLQYWRDLLDGQSHGSTQANPVAASLLHVIDQYHFPRKAFTDMCDARVFDLYDDPMDTCLALEGYAGETASALIQLAGLVLSAQDAVQTSEMAGHAGVAQAIAGLLLLMPLHRHRGQLYLPLEILTAVGLDRDSFLKGDDKTRISAAIEAFAGLGRDHLAKAQTVGGIPKKLLPAYLPVTLADPVLVAAQKKGAAIFDAPFQPAQWRRQWRMLSALAFGRL